MGHPQCFPLARVGGRRTRTPGAVLDQPVRPEPRRREVPAVRHRPVPDVGSRRDEDLLRDHRDGGDRELFAGESLHQCAQGAGLQVRPR